MPRGPPRPGTLRSDFARLGVMPKHPVSKTKNRAARSTRKKRPPTPSPEKVARAIVEAVIDQVALAFAPDE